MRKEYKEKGAQPDFDMVVEFESDRINIDISLEDTATTGKGWQISPNAPPVVC